MFSLSVHLVGEGEFPKIDIQKNSSIPQAPAGIICGGGQHVVGGIPCREQYVLVNHPGRNLVIFQLVGGIPPQWRTLPLFIISAIKINLVLGVAYTGSFFCQVRF